MGVDENYMNTMFDEYFIASAIDEHFSYELTRHNKPDIVKSLYKDAGKGISLLFFVFFQKKKKKKRFGHVSL